MVLKDTRGLPGFYPKGGVGIRDGLVRPVFPFGLPKSNSRRTSHLGLRWPRSAMDFSAFALTAALADSSLSFVK